MLPNHPNKYQIHVMTKITNIFVNSMEQQNSIAGNLRTNVFFEKPYTLVTFIDELVVHL